MWRKKVKATDDFKAELLTLKCKRPSEHIYFLDCEWHNMEARHLSEICAISICGTKTFHRYIRYPYALHREWRTLIQMGKVELSPWDSDDLDVAGTTLDVLAALFDFLPEGAVVFAFGTVDGVAIMRNLEEAHDGEKGEYKPVKEYIRSIWQHKAIRFLDARHTIRRFKTHYDLHIGFNMTTKKGATGTLKWQQLSFVVPSQIVICCK